MHDGWFWNQGAFSLAFAASWASYLMLDAPARRGEEETLLAYTDALGRAQQLYWVLPLTAHPSLTRGDAPYYLEWLAHPEPDAFWAARSLSGYDRIDVPALHVAGWYDIFVAGTLRSFSSLRRDGRDRGGRAGQKLVVGPWHHMPWWPLGIADEGVGANVVDDWQLRWFDHFLKGRDTGVLDSPVTVYVVGEGWRELDDWPPRAVEPTDFFLHSGGRANGSYGDGTLSRTAPGPESRRHLRLRPVAAGAERGRPLVLHRGAHADGARRPDARGAVERRARLHRRAARSRPRPARRRDGDALGRVERGRHRLHRAPLRRRRARPLDEPAGGHRPRPLSRLADGAHAARAGRGRALRIELGPVGVRIPAGHRLRIDVSSSDFPLWDRNLNTGGPIGAEGLTAAVPATQAVLHDAAHPSHVTLPVVP